MPKNIKEDTSEWYIKYYASKGKNRNDLLRNKGVLFQTLAFEKSIVKAFYNVNVEADLATVLDVGCGGGGDTYNLIRLGFSPKNITGIDILSERIEHARTIYPNISFYERDARNTQFEDKKFDIVFESTMFVQITNDSISTDIASEMIRVCKIGGYIVLIDWRTPNPFSKSYKALNKNRLYQLFNVRGQTELIGIYKGALIPPLGRFLSKYCSSLYFLISSILPFFVGQVVYVLRVKK